MGQEAVTVSDAQLVADIQRGESVAETGLYERYSARVFYVALAELRSREDAEDVRAETFLRVFQAIRQSRLRSSEALASFILGTAYNVIRETLRRDRRTEQLPDEGLEQYETHSLDDAFLDEDAKLTIERVTRMLKPREQAFLRMYYYEELPKEDIARALGIKEERLRLIKSRALKSFREIYERLTKKH